MSTVAITAQLSLDRNGYKAGDTAAVEAKTADFTLLVTEYIIDECIDFVNLLANSSIAALSGTPGAMTVSVSRDENAALKLLITCMLRDAKKTTLSNSSSTSNSSGTNSSVSAGGFSASDSSTVSSAVSAASSLNGMDDFTRDLFNKAIERLQAENANDPAIQDTSASPFYLGTSTNAYE
jgi:hypothetical protein